MPTYDDLGYAPRAAIRSADTRAVFGQVMGLVALTVGCAALGAYVGRNLSGGTGILFFIGAFACSFGLNAAAGRGHEQLAVGLMFGLGLLIGLAVAPVLNYYAKSNPAVVWQAAGATGAFVASSVPIAAGIFLDIFNVFLLLLRLFGGGGRNQ
jgi:FtsH-binding integral membrane protein